MHKTRYEVGEQVTNTTAFVSPIGAYFAAGSVFTVEIGGETAGRSIALRAAICGSRVWISDGLFLIDEPATAALAAKAVRS